MVRARAGRDCAERTRVVYDVGRALTAADATFLPDADVRVTEFSALVAGASDHVRLRLGGAVEASFAVGSAELVIAYGKLGGSVPASLLAAVERHVASHFGPIAREPG